MKTNIKTSPASYHLKFLAIVLMTVLQISVQGQNIDKVIKRAKKATYREGTIKLTSGEVINTYLFHDIQRGIVYKKDGKQFKPYSANDAISFSIQYEDKKRSYYSIPFDVYENGYKQAVFFEVLFEKNKVAILRNLVVKFRNNESNDYYTDPISGQRNPNPIDIDNFSKSSIYLVNGSSGIKKFSTKKRSFAKNTLTPTENNKIIKGTNKLGVIDKDVLTSFFGDSNSEIMEYIEEKDLNIRRLDHLLQITDYFVSIKSK